MHHITPLVINSLGVGTHTHTNTQHTHKHTDVHTETILRNQAYAGLQPTRARFKYSIDTKIFPHKSFPDYSMLMQIIMHISSAYTNALYMSSHTRANVYNAKHVVLHVIACVFDQVQIANTDYHSMDYIL